MVRAEDIEIPTTDGRPLGAVLLRPNTTPRAQIVIHGATAVPQSYYRAWATHLAERGAAVLTYDYRGIGRSLRGPVAHETVTMSGWIDDARHVQRWARAHAEGAPLVAVGHSFGGQIAPALEPAADAIVTVGAQGGYFDRFARPQRHLIELYMRGFIPAMTAMFGRLPGWAGLGEDLPPGVAKQWARWCSHPDYILSELPHLRDDLAAWSGPLFALSFDDDSYAALPNVQWLLDRFERATIEHDHIEVADLALPEVGHFGFFRKRAQAELWPRVDRFLATLGMGAPLVTETERVLADLQYGVG